MARDREHGGATCPRRSRMSHSLASLSKRTKSISEQLGGDRCSRFKSCHRQNQCIMPADLQGVLYVPFPVVLNR